MRGKAAVSKQTESQISVQEQSFFPWKEARDTDENGGLSWKIYKEREDVRMTMMDSDTAGDKVNLSIFDQISS